ncbi:MAG: hypothetical protein HC923_03480 [Myxococcales bacterium]|nr:hypothetical protein [Myxococcales bacterium]
MQDELPLHDILGNRFEVDDCHRLKGLTVATLSAPCQRRGVAKRMRTMIKVHGDRGRSTPR